MIPVFDTHAHYNLSPIYDDWERYLTVSQGVGVRHANVVGTNLETSQLALELKAKNPDYFAASIGLHPENVNQLIAKGRSGKINLAEKIDEMVYELDDMAKAHPDFDAWGEIGLDFFRLDRQSEEFQLIKEWQEDLLCHQLVTAADNPRPVVLHVRDDPEYYDDPQGAYFRTQNLIKECECADLPIIFHCFSGSEKYLTACLALPHSYISFAGNLTFKSAHNLRALARQVPADRLLLETDCPFLSPEPVRGRACEPAFIRHTAHLAARECGIDLEQVYQNSICLFGKNEV